MRFINLYLLVVLTVLLLTGTYALFFTWTPWIFDLHRAAGWMLVATLPWKTLVIARSLKRGLRPNIDRGLMVAVSLLAALIALLVIALGAAWLWRIGPAQIWLRQTLISWHWMLGLALAAPLIFHVWRRWPRPRRADFISRRGFLRTAGLTAAGLAAWAAGEALARLQTARAAAAQRRFTGSRRAASFSANDFPVTHNAGEADHPIDPAAWRLLIEDEHGAQTAWTLPDLDALPKTDLTAVIDCTLGWYSTQVWQGIPLTALLPFNTSGQWSVAGGQRKNEPPGSQVRQGKKNQQSEISNLQSIIPNRPIAQSLIPFFRNRKSKIENRKFLRLESVTGYTKTIPWNEASQILLATHVGGEPINHLHGFPLRAVVPTRRGWFWVKWLTRIQVVQL